MSAASIGRVGGGESWSRAEVRRARLILIVPLIFVAALFFYPLADLLRLSFVGGGSFAAPYGEVLGEAVFQLALWNTFVLALLTAAIAAVIGYPVAILVGFSPPRAAAVLLLLVMVPFWTSVLVRSYAWLVILGREGLVNNTLIWLSPGSRPLQLIFNRTGVLVAMVHVMLPYMILPLVNAISRLDKNVLAAASSLGASRWQSFVRVLLPLTAPGLAGGFALVFVLSLGFFITPALMGGPRDIVTAMVVHEQVTRQLAWDKAAAVSVILLLLMGGAFFVCARVFGLRPSVTVR